MKVVLKFILMLIAWLLMRVLITVSFVYTTIKLIIKLKFQELGDYYYDSALTLDMSGNIIGQHFFNDIMIKPDGYRFGKFGVTISKTLAVNKKINKWYPIGRGLGRLLNLIDKDHLEKSKV